MNTDVTEITTTLKGMTGGTKQIWLKNNRDLILNFYLVMGARATRKAFRLGQITLDGILAQGDSNDDFRTIKAMQAEMKIMTQKIERMEKLVEIKHEEYLEIRAENRKLIELHSAFLEQTAMRVSELIIKPLVKQLTAASEQPYPISETKSLPPDTRLSKL